MIDLHSHILAGIDDGAATIDDSLALIRGAFKSGVTKILATPHIHLGTFDNNLHTIEHAYLSLIKQLQHEELSISIAYAAEIRICPEILLMVKQQQLPFMGKWDKNDVLLLEFPHSHIPPGSEKLIDWLLKHNITPMIAHPERNRDLWKFVELLRPFKQQGCLFQITACSLLGDFGNHAKQIAWQMVEAGEVTVVASDMHNLLRRPCKMDDAYQEVLLRCGKETAEQLFVNNPNLIFESNPTQWMLK